MVLSIKVEIPGRVMEMGTHEFDDIVHVFEMLNMEFSKLTLVEVYVVQHAVAT